MTRVYQVVLVPVDGTKNAGQVTFFECEALTPEHAIAKTIVPDGRRVAGVWEQNVQKNELWRMVK